MPNLTFKGKQFYMDGEPIEIISGTMHYFRIPEDYWYDRLLKLKECGFNTVETYTCWNLHEPEEGKFDFTGMLDIEKYVQTATDLGLYVILRPGPYICAEWDCGGLPAWLLTYRDIDIRCNNEVYLSKVDRYYKELLTRLNKHFSGNGGNIVMIQVENEYGSFGSDKEYLRAVAAMYEKYDAKALYFTSDGPTYTMLNGGTLPEYLAVANFGSNPKEQFKKLEEYRPDQPLMCGEYWNGWFDQWEKNAVTRDYMTCVNDLKDFLEIDASINVYMFHGGTNFNFWAGANMYDKVFFDTTSYDYGSPVSEAGDRTPMYYAFRDAIIAKYGEDKVPPLTAKESEKKAYGKVTMTKTAALFDNLDNIGKKFRAPAPRPMEDFGQAFGYILYSAEIPGPMEGWPLHIDELHDRANIYVNGEYKATYHRNNPVKDEEAVSIPIGFGESAKLDVLVENQGRINYGPFMADRKGCTRIRFAQCQHHGWDVYTLPMNNLEKLDFKPIENVPTEESPLVGPNFFKAELEIEGKPCDTFLKLDGFTKGFVTVNGFNLGRYWKIGPQKTLYVPAPILKEGVNEIIVFENDETATLDIEFTDVHDLGR
ncbi:MAG: beta-galactosidase [Clostridia bacterium]|nr:beta-galactosidase [Clostridia bacterium]